MLRLVDRRRPIPAETANYTVLVLIPKALPNVQSRELAVFMHDTQMIRTEDLEQEKSQLVSCRRAFYMLGMAFVLHIAGMFLFPIFSEVTPERDIVRTAPAVVFALAMGQLVCLMIPAAALLLKCGRSDRWKTAAKMLLLTLVVDLGILIGLVVFGSPGVVLTEPQPLGVRILQHCSEVLAWLEWWWIAVLIAEFSLASRSEFLVNSTELLGYAILGGLFASLAFAAWSLPMPHKPGNLPDTVSILLQVISLMLVCVVLFWEFRLTAITATLAQVLAQHCEELKQSKLRKVES